MLKINKGMEDDKYPSYIYGYWWTVWMKFYTLCVSVCKRIGLGLLTMQPHVVSPILKVWKKRSYSIILTKVI